MEAAKVLSLSRTAPFCFSIVSNKVSLRPFNKHFHADVLANRPKSISFQLNCSYGDSFSSSPKPARKRTNLLPSPRCSISSNASTEYQNPVLEFFRNLSFDSIKATLLQLTPIDVVKWSGILCIITAATKWTRNMLFSPFFWMYFSWTWLFWPWFVAIVLAVYGLYCFRKHLHGEANIFEQLAIVTSVFTWLTLVPPGHFNGYLEGWPFVFFFVAVVQFGPYRWVRHPIYSSTMLLFVTYCIALRAPLSLLFVVAVCLMYYKQKAEKEEALMVETFGQRYTEYASKVKFKFIPFVY
uniref:Protein-S-isoprenylcysteine O-methyltransferase n=1 Tax=Cajanus cajan TaxID=3821 RepID=A0A151QRT9_CAJCA|nr:hypothetical protein KK1_046217 [Cajanus cajan]